jgi:ribosomal protein S27E
MRAKCPQCGHVGKVASEPPRHVGGKPPLADRSPQRCPFCHEILPESSAGDAIRIAASRAIIAITTSNSISVKPAFRPPLPRTTLSFRFYISCSFLLVSCFGSGFDAPGGQARRVMLL